MIKITSTHLHDKNQFHLINNKNTKEVNGKKTESNQPDSKTIKYILEGGFIKVYLVGNDGTRQCLRTIPLEDADPAILSQVENISFLDMIMFNEMQNDKVKQAKDKNKK